MKRIRGRLDNKIRICDNAYLYLAELDELVLSFREVRDYKVRLLTGNCLSIEIMTENEDVFQKIRNKIAECIQKYLYEKFGHCACLTIRISRKSELYKITNSMVKRMIT